MPPKNKSRTNKDFNEQESNRLMALADTALEEFPANTKKRRRSEFPLEDYREPELTPELTPEERSVILGIWDRNFNLLVYNSYFNLLSKKGYSKEQIIKLVSTNMAKANAEAILQFHDRFMELDFEIEQLVSIVGRNNGALNLHEIAQVYPTLVELKLSNADITSLASSYNGYENIKTFISYCTKLMELGYSKDQLVKIASFDEGFRNLDALIIKHNQWQDLRYSFDEITAVAADRWGYTKLYNPVKKIYSVENTAANAPLALSLSSSTSSTTSSTSIYAGKASPLLFTVSGEPAAKKPKLSENSYPSNL